MSRAETRSPQYQCTHNKFGENPWIITQVIVRKFHRRTDGHTDDQRETIIPRHYACSVEGIKRQKTKQITKQKQKKKKTERNGKRSRFQRFPKHEVRSGQCCRSDRRLQQELNGVFIVLLKTRRYNFDPASHPQSMF